MSCGGDLPERWYHDEAILRAEFDAHGRNLSEVARAHGVTPQTLSVWWRKLGLGELTTGRHYKPRPPVTDDDGVTQEEILRQRVQELERAAGQHRDRDVFEERVVRAVTASCQTKTPTYKPTAHKRAGGLQDHEFALLWSDTHAGEVVSREETNGLGEYDWQTMMRRHDAITRGVVSYLEHRPYKVRRLHIWALGDMLSGDIHEELTETNEMPGVECAVQFGLDAAEWLEGFLSHFDEIHFAGVVGNHPRVKRKQPSKRRYNNLDWLAYHVMQQRLRAYGQIRWEIPRAQKWPVEICGKRVLLYHGDGIRSTMTDVPWGGIIRYTNKLANQYARAGTPIDHFACGHYHEANSVKNRRLLMNGSVKGIDEYSVDAFGGGESPTQLLATFHQSRGLTDVSYIDLAA